MALNKEQTFTKTSFKAQAAVISDLLRTNPMIDDDNKRSLNETVGVLTWLNQLQLHWAGGGAGTPEDISRHLFEGREGQPNVTQPA